MAATRLIALHINKGKTIAQCLRDRTDYAQNPGKTEKGELVSGYECDPMTADEEFLLAKRQYLHITGRRQQNDVLPIRFVSPSNRVRLHRRKPTGLAMNWGCGSPKENTLFW